MSRRRRRSGVEGKAAGERFHREVAIKWFYDVITRRCLTVRFIRFRRKQALPSSLPCLSANTPACPRRPPCACPCVYSKSSRFSLLHIKPFWKRKPSNKTVENPLHAKGSLPLRLAGARAFKDRRLKHARTTRGSERREEKRRGENVKGEMGRTTAGRTPPPPPPLA